MSDAATTVADGGVSDAAATVVDEGVSDAAATVVDGGVSDGAATVADEGGSDAAQATVLMIASGMRFATPALTVPPGAAITVRNEDSIPHTVTSESGPGAFSPSGVFDTGNIAAGETAMIMIPASATPGTVYYYYCAIHSSLMTPPNGTITVQ